MVTLLFDIDGTLLRLKPGISRGFVFDAFASATDTIVPPSLNISFAGMTDQGIFRLLAQTCGVSINPAQEHELWAAYTTKLSERFQELHSKDVEPMDGIHALLEQLQADSRNSLALLTGNTRSVAFEKLRAAQLDHLFEHGAFGEHSHNRNHLPPLAIEATGATAAGHCLIVGDTPADIACAHAHNIPVVAVATGPFSTSELLQHKPDYCLPRITDSIQFLRIVEEQHERQIDYSN